MISDMTSALSVCGCRTVSDINSDGHHAFCAAFVRPGIPQMRTAKPRGEPHHSAAQPQRTRLGWRRSGIGAAGFNPRPTNLPIALCIVMRRTGIHDFTLGFGPGRGRRDRGLQAADGRILVGRVGWMGWTVPRAPPPPRAARGDGHRHPLREFIGGQAAEREHLTRDVVVRRPQRRWRIAVDARSAPKFGLNASAISGTIRHLLPQFPFLIRLPVCPTWPPRSCHTERAASGEGRAWRRCLW
jgi:hypothetical protein